MCGPTLFNDVAIGTIARLPDIGSRVGTLERPETGTGCPEARRRAVDESGGRTENINATGIRRKQLVCRGVQPKLVKLHIADPARQFLAIRPEEADVDLIDVRSAHVDANR